MHVHYQHVSEDTPETRRPSAVNLKTLFCVPLFRPLLKPGREVHLSTKAVVWVEKTRDHIIAYFHSSSRENLRLFLVLNYAENRIQQPEVPTEVSSLIQ